MSTMDHCLCVIKVCGFFFSVNIFSLEAGNNLIFLSSMQKFIKFYWANSGQATLVAKNLIMGFVKTTEFALSRFNPL